MTETLAQFLAGGLLILVAAFAGVVGYRIGKRRGMREASQITDTSVAASRGEPHRKQRPPRPPSPPTVVH